MNRHRQTIKGDNTSREASTRKMRRPPVLLTAMLCFMLLQFGAGAVSAQQFGRIGIEGTRFTLDNEPFDFTGISFFNALYNPVFNKDNETQLQWLKKLNSYGINALRIWAEWNSDLGFVNTCNICTLYQENGTLRPVYLERMERLAANASTLNMVLEVVLFSSESKNKKLTDQAAEYAVREVTIALKPYRNVLFQIWNEYDYRTLDYFSTIKRNDPARLVSNSPGGGGTLGGDEENAMLDYLSPHTTRQGRHWERAAAEISALIKKFRKPVVDNEPARNGTPKFGGPEGESYPYDQILHIYNVWKEGGYMVYHHDMFQMGEGSASVPPGGIPDPEFNPYHKTALSFVRERKRYK